MSQEPTETKTPAAPAPRSRSVMAVAYLATMFAAGLGLVYVVEGGRPSAAADAQAASAPAGEPMKPAQPQADLTEVAAASGEQIAALEDKTQGLVAELSSVQASIQSLEASLASIKEDQVAMLEVERNRIASELQALASRQDEQAAEVDGGAEGLPDAYLEGALAALGAVSTPDGLSVTMAESQLRFPPGKAEPDAAAASAALAGIARVLKDQPGLRVVLRGHTDSSGDAEMNRALSQRRALAVRDAFIALGIHGGRIRAEGLGEAQPVADNETPEGRSRNRRVEVLLLEVRGSAEG
ncbi:OmpA family protein [Thiorhodococcus minor]|uniref:OmpA family protein n=1 Tax=Thiorhodococcus minor TaxID=57489 RepID=A0A6M0K2H8_9GAMM|nr:OmpA family protein [Thiorhodococcus minor]NEV62545.1 OmpA family protein [Thiorhodococcus minor]